MFAVAGLFSHIAGRTALLGSAAHIGVSRAASFRVAAPVITVTFGVFFLNESVSWPMVAGLAVMSAGLLLLTVESRETHGLRSISGSRQEAGDDVRMHAALASESSRGFVPNPESDTDRFNNAHRAASSGANVVGSKGTVSVRTGLLVGFVAAAAFGSGDVLRKGGMSALPDAWIASFATSAGSVVVVTAAAGLGGRLEEAVSPPTAGRRHLVFSGVLSTAALFSFFQSLHYIPVSVATPVNGTQGLFAALFGWLLNNSVEHVRGRLVIASAIVVVGLALFVSG